MELKEYYKILKANFSVAIYTIIIAIVAVYTWSVRESETFSASALLNISRSEAQATADYRFDQYYRLQADEKFADTVAAWLKSPGVAQAIFEKADINAKEKTIRQLAKSFQAEKLSSSTVSVKYAAPSEGDAQKIASAISSITSDKTKSLNADSKDPNWFQTDESNLVIHKNTQNIPVNLGIAALAGLALGIFLAFGKHYISEEN